MEKESGRSTSRRVALSERSGERKPSAKHHSCVQRPPAVGADPRVCPNKGVGLSASKSFKNLFQNLSKWAYDNSCLTSYALFEFLDVQEIRGAIIFTPILPNLQNIGKNYFKSGLTESSKVSLLTYPLFTLLKANSLMRPRFTNPIMSLLAVVALTKNLF